MIDWIMRRLREPSSWAGLGTLAMAIGISDAQWGAIAQIGSGIAALVAILMHDSAGGRGAA